MGEKRSGGRKGGTMRERRRVRGRGKEAGVGKGTELGREEY